MPRAVFLDRDDTIIHCRSVTEDGDLGDPSLVKLIDGVPEACAKLAKAGFKLIVVSNQGGVARGVYTENDVNLVHEEVNRQLEGLIDHFYFCPFHPKGVIAAYRREHPSRKPHPGMLWAAHSDHRINLKRSWMVGDTLRDCQAGRAAGCETVLISTQTPTGTDASFVDHVVPDITAAARIILKAQKAQGAPA